ncbi:unnamed protein product [Brassicogethes aeneus]|uniref:CCHC-type domain-containing protein n=1 Tax=Brassicogethes aeneus TaxID=1431903 RepID=A0A9P0AS71_BRAAE|nr:unnamed protein product [Brassicogethes aeneus]
MELIISLSQALKGEAANWLVSAKPSEKEWSELKAEFLAVFARPVDSLEVFSEAINGKKNISHDVPLIDEMLFSMRNILSLLKNRESDESFAVTVACYFGSTRDDYVRKRYTTDKPVDAKSMCTMLQGRLGKRSAIFPSSHHTGSKRQALSLPSKNERFHKRPVNCFTCGKAGHKAADCRSPSASVPFRSKKTDREVTCFKCGKLGHFSGLSIFGRQTKNLREKD